MNKKQASATRVELSLFDSRGRKLAYNSKYFDDRRSATRAYTGEMFKLQLGIHRPSRKSGIEEVASFVETWDAHVTSEYRFSDIIRFKYGLISRSRMRKNKHWKPVPKTR